jgi:hypothetical protein
MKLRALALLWILVLPAFLTACFSPPLRGGDSYPQEPGKLNRQKDGTQENNRHIDNDNDDDDDDDDDQDRDEDDD